MKYLIYQRVSEEDQVTKTQQEECYESIIKIQKGEPFSYKVYDEEELSSRKPIEKRPKLIEMLADIRPGDTVIVYKLDRLARDNIELLQIYRLITKTKKANLIAVNDPYADEFSVSIMAAVAQKERDMISLRTKSRLKSLKKESKRISRFPPYGFAFADDQKTLIPNDQEQAVIELVRDLQANNGSYQDIALQLTNQGLRNRNGQPFQKMTIYRILKREALPELANSYQSSC